jgi:ABC-2 type transport system permease protein
MSTAAQQKDDHNHNGFITLLGREVHRFVRLYNQTIIPPVLTAALFLVIFGYSLGSRINTVQDVPYLHFIIPGLVMMSVITSAYANTSSSLYIARFQGHIQELLVSSMSTLEIVLALILGGVIRGVVVGIIISITSMLMAGAPLMHIGLTVYFMVCVAIIFSCCGFLSAMWADNFDRLSLFQTYILTPMTYLGGVFFSIGMLPPFWQKVALFNPILYFVNGLRYGFLETTDVNITIAATASLLLAIGLFAGCYILFRRGYNIKT